MMFSLFNKIAFFACSLLALSMAMTASALPVGKRTDLEKRHFAGQATFFEVGLGSCGWSSNNNQYVVAINSPQVEGQSHCGKTVAILNQQKGIWQYATVVDECPSCNFGSLDMSPALFGALNEGNMDQGVFPIGWHFLN